MEYIQRKTFPWVHSLGENRDTQFWQGPHDKWQIMECTQEQAICLSWIRNKKNRRKEAFCFYNNFLRNWRTKWELWELSSKSRPPKIYQPLTRPHPITAALPPKEDHPELQVMNHSRPWQQTPTRSNLSQLLSWLGRDTMTKTTYKAFHLGLAYSFKGREYDRGREHGSRQVGMGVHMLKQPPPNREREGTGTIGHWQCHVSPNKATRPPLFQLHQTLPPTEHKACKHRGLRQPF